RVTPEAGMDFRTQGTEYSAAVPLDWGFADRSVLRSGAGDSREPAVDALDRRAIYANAVLWSSEDELVARRTRLCSQPETGTATDEADGSGSDLSKTAAVEGGAGTSK